MAESENLQKLKRILGRTADLIREAEGSSEPIQVSDMRQKVAAMDIATFNIDDNHVLKGHTVVNGTTDSSTPEDTADYYRKLLTNFANKVRVGSDKLDIDQIEEQENLVCGVHKVDGKYGLTIPEGVTSIGFNAFLNKTALTSINLPESVKSISSSAFKGCNNLISVDLPDSITTIGGNAFANCLSLTSVSLPDNLAHLYDEAFSGCKSLALITIPEGVTEINRETFKNCSKLTSISLPNNLVSIN